MLQSQQRVVAQEANINVVEIRMAEIDYFSAFFNSFGTQAALIAGFSAGALEIEDADTSDGFKYLYWIMDAIAFVAAMHVVLSCAFIAVFGQGLALRGPVGSMAKAVEGMVIEQEHVIIAFCISVTTFTVGSIGSNWALMSGLGATLTTVLVLVGITVWYSHCLRIYNRFKFVSFGHRDSSARLEFQPKKAANNSKSTADDSSIEIGGDDVKLAPDNSSKPIAKQKTWMFGATKSTAQVEEPIAIERKLNFEGYVSTTISSSGTNIIPGAGNWKNLYAVLKDTLIYFYASKAAFESAPNEPVRRRPVDLEGLKIVTKSSVAPFAAVLEPISDQDDRNPLEIRFLTLSEMSTWMDVLSDAAKKANHIEAIGSPANPSSKVK